MNTIRLTVLRNGNVSAWGHELNSITSHAFHDGDKTLTFLILAMAWTGADSTEILSQLTRVKNKVVFQVNSRLGRDTEELIHNLKAWMSAFFADPVSFKIEVCSSNPCILF
jgi:hypothetical protein